MCFSCKISIKKNINWLTVGLSVVVLPFSIHVILYVTCLYIYNNYQIFKQKTWGCGIRNMKKKCEVICWFVGNPLISLKKQHGLLIELYVRYSHENMKQDTRKDQLMTFYKGDTSNYTNNKIHSLRWYWNWRFECSMFLIVFIGLRYKKMLHIRIINAQGKMRHNVSCFERILHVLFITFVRVMNDLS